MRAYIIHNVFFLLFILIDNSRVTLVIQHNFESQEKRVLFFFFLRREKYKLEMDLDKMDLTTKETLQLGIMQLKSLHSYSQVLCVVYASWPHSNWMKPNLINRSQQKRTSELTNLFPTQAVKKQQHITQINWGMYRGM